MGWRKTEERTLADEFPELIPHLKTNINVLDAGCGPGTSVAERSFSLNDGVETFVKPMPQPILCRRRQLQDATRKAQGLKDFKIASRIHDDMRAAATKLVKR